MKRVYHILNVSNNLDISFFHLFQNIIFETICISVSSVYNRDAGKWQLHIIT